LDYLSLSQKIKKTNLENRLQLSSFPQKETMGNEKPPSGLLARLLSGGNQEYVLEKTE
jgi:hypothetical protein